MKCKSTLGRHCKVIHVFFAVTKIFYRSFFHLFPLTLEWCYLYWHSIIFLYENGQNLRL